MTQHPLTSRSWILAFVVSCTLVFSCSSDRLLAPISPPFVAEMTAGAGVQGTTISLTLRGRHFVPGATIVAISGAGVTVGSVEVTDEASLTASIAIAAGAALGQRRVTVATAGGASAAMEFTVNPPPPALTSVTPSVGVQGTTSVLSLVGTSFVAGGTTVSVSGANVAVQNVSVASATLLTAEVVVGAEAALGGRTVTIATAGGTSGSQPFTINPPVPTLDGLSATTGVTGTTVTQTFSGRNLVAGAMVAVSGTGITVSDVAVLSDTSMTARFTISADAALGERTVTVTTAGGATLAQTFVVLPPTPTLASLSAATGVTGTTFTQTLAGTNLVAGATVAVSGTGVAVANVTVTSSTSLTATFTLSGTAELGGHEVIVTTSGGTSNPRTFTVLPPVPTVASMTPGLVVRGTTQSVTLVGTSFVAGATTVAVSGTGITVGTVDVTSGTSLTVDIAVAADAALEARLITVSTTGGVSEAVPFMVLPPTPTLASLSAATGVTGTTMTQTFTGTNLVTGATVAVSGAGVAVSDVTVTSGTSMTASFTIAADAPLGTRAIAVTTAGGTTAELPFAVLPPVPALTSLTPGVAVQGTSQSVTLTGTSFVVGATTVAVSGAGVTVGTVDVSSDTSLTANVTITGNGALGTRTVTVTTAGGTSGAQALTINPPLPTLAAVTPSVGVRGATQSIALTGTSFVPGATTVMVSGANVTVSNVDVSSGTTMTADVAIGVGAALGVRTITVITAGGTSGGQPFTINPPLPTLATVTPHIGVQGETQVVALTGTEFVSGTTTVSVSGAGVTASDVDVTSGTTLTANLTVARGAALGAHGITISTAGGTSNAQPFTVLPSTPTLAGIAPATGVRGTAVDVVITGDHFVSGATAVTVDGAGITVGTVNVTSGSSLTATLTVSATAGLGAHDVTVTTAGGVSSPQTFMVLAPVPTFTGVSPASGIRGTAVPVTLTGTHLASAPVSVAVSGTGVVVSDLVVGGETSLTATFTLDAGAVLGDRGVTVTTAGGTSGPQTFTVQAAPPTLTTVAPSAGIQGATHSVTLTGTNFIAGATTVALSGGDIVVGAVDVTSTTSLTAELTIAQNAPVGARDVTVTTAGGASGTQPFTVLSSLPTLIDVSPSSGALGSVVPVTLTGTNFTPGTTTVAVSGGGVTVGTVVVSSSTSLQTTFTINGAAVLGARNVTVTTGTGTSGAQPFTVTGTAPTLASVAPATGVRGTTVSVTLTGTDFIAGATSVAVSGTGVTASNVVVASSTSLTVDFIVAAGAVLGARDITVATAAGVSGVRTFTVLPPPPTMTTLTPNTSARGVGQNVTVTGTNFVPGATTVTVSGTGVTVSNVNVTSATTLTANLFTATGAVVGARNVTVTTPGGASGAQTFTVITEPARFVYMSVEGDSSIHQFSISASTGALTPLGVTPLGVTFTDRRPFDIAVDPSGRYAYSPSYDASRVSMFTIDTTTGALTFAGYVASNGHGSRRIAVDPSGRYAYLLNEAGLSGGIGLTMFTIDGSGRLVANGTFSVNGLALPRGITVDPLGRFVYVTWAFSGPGRVTTFQIAGNGTLILCGIAVAANPSGVAADPSGRFVYVGSASNVAQFSVAPNGSLTPIGTVAGNGTMTSVVADATGNYVYALDGVNHELFAYSIDQVTGTLSQIGAKITLGNAATTIATDPQAKFVYVGGQGSSGTLVYSIQPGGALSLASSLSAANAPSGIAVSR